MPSAASNWHTPPDLPSGPKALCLVLMEHHGKKRTHHVMRYVREQWYFEEGMELSRSYKVLYWAYIKDPIAE